MRTRLPILVLAVALAGLAVPDPAALATSPPGAEGGHGWAALGVPRVDLWNIRFRGNSMPTPTRQGVASIAVTLDSALVMVGNATSRANRLVELPAHTGDARPIGRRLIGIPLADPAGHRVFWTTRIRGERPVLRAYDTDTGRSYRSPAPMLIQAVEGGTAYGFLLQGGWRSWTPGPGSGLEAVAPAIDEESFLSDVAGGLQAITSFADDTGPSVVGADGSTVASGMPGFFGIFDPAGTHLLMTGEHGVRLWNLAQDRSMDLTGLGGRRALSARWSPTGDLVVQTLLHKSDEHLAWDDGHPLLFFDCPMPEGSAATVGCVALPSRRRMLEPAYESTALGQFAALLPYSRPQAPKAPGVDRYLR